MPINMHRDKVDDRPLIHPINCMFDGLCFEKFRDFLGRMLRKENKVTIKLLMNNKADWLCDICACVCSKRKVDRNG